MEDLTNSDIATILETLEDGYDIIKNNFRTEEENLLLLADKMLEEMVLPSLDIPMTLIDHLSFLKTGGLNGKWS